MTTTTITLKPPVTRTDDKYVEVVFYRKLTVGSDYLTSLWMLPSALPRRNEWIEIPSKKAKKGRASQSQVHKVTRCYQVRWNEDPSDVRSIVALARVVVEVR